MRNFLIENFLLPILLKRDDLIVIPLFIIYNNFEKLDYLFAWQRSMRLSISIAS